MLAVMLMAALPTEAEGQIYADTVRLHIPAHSDAEEDQSVKIYVRDRLLEAYGERLSAFPSAEDAEAALRNMLPEMERDVAQWLTEAGVSYGASITVTREWYDRREYADSVYPAGTYASLRVVLGDGAGKNWWCVMFPPLCLDMALGEAIPYSAEEKDLIGGKYRLKLKSLELAAGLFR